MTFERNKLSKALIQTNPKLTGNLKIVIDSSQKIWMNSIDANDSLSQTKYKRFPIRSNENYPTVLNRFLGKNFPADQLFELFETAQPTSLKKSFTDQYQQFYMAGVGPLIDKNYTEQFYCFSPLYIKDILPTHFVIFKLPGAFSQSNNISSDKLVVGNSYKVIPKSTTWKFTYNGIIYDEINSPNGVNFIAIIDQNYQSSGKIIVLDVNENDTINYIENPANFNDIFLKNAKIVETFDLVNSPIGKFISNSVNDSLYPESPLNISFDKENLSYWNGASYKDAVYATKGENLSAFYSSESTIKGHDQYITSGFERNNLIYPHIFNFEFLFNDTEDEDWKFNRYYGMYIIENEVGKFLLDGENYYRFTDFNIQSPKLLKPNTFGYYWMENPVQANNLTGVELYMKSLSSNIKSYIDSSVIKKETVFTIKSKGGKFKRILDRDSTVDYEKLKLYNKTVRIDDFSGFRKDNILEVPAEFLGPKGRASFSFKIKPKLQKYIFPNSSSGYVFEEHFGLSYGSIIQIDWANTNLPLKINDESIVNGGIRIEPLRHMDPDNRILKYPDEIIETRVMGYHLYSDSNDKYQILLNPVTNPGGANNIIFCQWADDVPSQNLKSADIIAKSIANSFNNLPAIPFKSFSIKDTIYIVCDSQTDLYNNIKFSTNLPAEEFEIIKDQYVFGGGSIDERRVKIDKSYLSLLNIGDWVKTKSGYSQIQSISPYVDEPSTMYEEVISYIGINDHITITLKNDIPSVIDGKIQIYRPYETPVSLLSFIDIVDFDFSFNESNYSKTLSYETERYQGISGTIPKEISPVTLLELGNRHGQQPSHPILWMSNLNDNWMEGITLPNVNFNYPEIWDMFQKLDCYSSVDGLIGSPVQSKLPIIDRITGNALYVNGPGITDFKYFDSSLPIHIYPLETMSNKWFEKNSNIILMHTSASKNSMPNLFKNYVSENIEFPGNLNVESLDTIIAYKINKNTVSINFKKINLNEVVPVFSTTNSEITPFNSDYQVGLNKNLDFTYTLDNGIYELTILKNFLWKLHYVYHTNYPQFRKFRYYILKYVAPGELSESYYIIPDQDLVSEFEITGNGLTKIIAPLVMSQGVTPVLNSYSDWSPFLESEYLTDPENLPSSVLTYNSYIASNDIVSLTTNETKDFIGFNHLNDIITTNKNDLIGITEYSKLKENSLKEFNYVSQIIPTINKWVYEGGTDVRSNKYRLNANTAFGQLNFSPSFVNFDPSTKFFTHEWPYLAKYPINLKKEDYINTFNYLGLNLSYSEFKTKILDETVDNFTNLLIQKTVGPNAEVRILPAEKFSKIVYSSETGCSTVFRGVKLSFNERLESTKLIYDYSVPTVKNSNKYEDYKFTAILFLKEKSKIFTQKNSVDYEILVNDTYKTITFTIQACLEDYKLTSISLDSKNSIDYFNLYNLKSQKKTSGNAIIYDDVIINGSIIWTANSNKFKTIEYLCEKDGRHLIKELSPLEIFNFNRNYNYSRNPNGSFNNLTIDINNYVQSPTLNWASNKTQNGFLQRSNLIINPIKDSLSNPIFLGFNDSNEYTFDSITGVYNFNSQFRYFDSKKYYLPKDPTDIYPLFGNVLPIIGDCTVNSMPLNIFNINDDLATPDVTVLQKAIYDYTNNYFISTLFSFNDFYQGISANILDQIEEYSKLDNFVIYPNGGYLFNQSIIDELSFANINNKILTNDPKINYLYSNKSLPKLWIQTEQPEIITLNTLLHTTEDSAKPNDLKLEPIIGYVTETITDKLNIYRYSGPYEPLLKTIVSFNDLTNNNVSLSSVKFDTEVTNFGQYERWYYKVSDNVNILKSNQYPLIDEYAIASSHEYIFKSQWDQDFFKYYSDKNKFIDKRGSRTMMDIKLPYTSKSPRVTESIKIETISDLAVSTLYTATQLIITINYLDQLNYRLSNLLRDDFNNWIDFSIGEVDSRTNEENLNKYVKYNVQNLYDLFNVELWKLSGIANNGLVINLNDQQKQANGFIKQQRFALSNINGILTITLPLSDIKSLYSISLNYKRI